MPHRRRQSRPALVDRDIHCVECGYNLRSLRRIDLCPECSTPVKRSLAGPLLRNAGTRWLKRVHRGLWLLHRASVIAAFALIGMPVFDIYSHVYLNPAFPTLSFQGIPLTLAIWSAVASIGLWLATSPTPRDDQRPGLQSTLERITLLAIPVNTLAWIAFGLLGVSALTGVFGNPLGALGVPAPGQVTSRITIFALAAITWLQSNMLARWLNRIDARVDHAIRREPTIFDRINWALTRSHDNPPGASAEFWRGAAKWSPVALAALIIFAAIGQRSFPWKAPAVMGFLPLMILLTLRRTARDVGAELAINIAKNPARERDEAVA